MQENHSTAPENIIFYKTPCFLIYDSPEVKEYPMHWHNAVEILMPEENDFPVVCGDREYLLKENHILIIPPGELHNLKARKGRRIIMLCDNSMFNDNPALSELGSVFTKPLWINGDYDRGFLLQLNDIILDMLRIFDASPPFCEVILYQRFITLLLKIAEHIKHRENEEKSKLFDKTELIGKYIDSFYMNPITLDTLSEALGYSKFHISRLLSNSGLSFSDMVNERRIRAAEILLRNDSLSITQAAFSAGFSSITTFNRVFRRLKGCTPTRFRELYREENI